MWEDRTPYNETAANWEYPRTESFNQMITIMDNSIVQTIQFDTSNSYNYICQFTLNSTLSVYSPVYSRSIDMNANSVFPNTVLVKTINSNVVLITSSTNSSVATATVSSTTQANTYRVLFTGSALGSANISIQANGDVTPGVVFQVNVYRKFYL